MAKIGIIQVDGDIPNLALMKIAGYHESIGDSVEWWQGPLFNNQYSKVYASKIFNFSSLPDGIPGNTVIGGTGIDHFNKLPAEIESATPSYSLYLQGWGPSNQNPHKNYPLSAANYHLGFSMKGCRFACKFCVVPKKEGRPYLYNAIDEILINSKGENRLMLLDNDFFGGSNWKQNLIRIKELKLKVCFVQGLNIRIITVEQAELLSTVNYTNSKFNQKYLTFAWDKYDDEKLIHKGIKICNDAGIPCRQMQFFVLIGFDSTKEQDYSRVMALKKLGCMPFVMPFNKNDPYQKSFTRWVNQRAVFNSCSWKDYKYKA